MLIALNNGASTVVESIEEAKQRAFWGTNGKGGMEHCMGSCPKHKLRWVRLADCNTEHLKAIMRVCHHIRGTSYESIILSILKDRTDGKEG